MKNGDEPITGASAYLQAQIFALDVVLTSVVATHPSPKAFLAQLVEQTELRLRHVRAMQEQYGLDPVMEKATGELLANWLQLAQQLVSGSG